MKELNEDFLFGGIEANDESLNVFDKKTTSQDGIYRCLLKDAKDAKLGYRATIRFLPNLIKSEDGKIERATINLSLCYMGQLNNPITNGVISHELSHLFEYFEAKGNTLLRKHEVYNSF